ncbi:helix-turn-helix domain-containing protein [Anabaena subtropica]|uniref:Helix-turn-helix transcriptional regulator n=1 Tax=Anabaena subtropica FACHB-260 TaxID=2692884 RepID=A0ABR8CV97_9NOST|nr:helix-turn-helix transcriptional regulator [Anabaena subtropica]MBD2347122.1 helix-turn-helix transcriptional regulator [Anabaena subtropica FACHB-260]
MQTTANRDTSFGNLLKYWRNQRNFSQLDLAVVSEVSQRHISFLESGRAKPSRDMVVQLAAVLDVPLRYQNVMLTAAGFAPIYSERDLSASEIAPIRKALDFILRQQEPYPALVMDRYWNLIQSNTAAQRLIHWLINPQQLQNMFDSNSKLNLMRLMFHPQGLKPFIANWEEIANDLIQRVYRETLAEGCSQESLNLFQQLQTYPDVPQMSHIPNVCTWQMPLLTVQFVKKELSLSLFSTIATLGTPHDITLQELRIESLFPADELTEVNLKKIEISSDDNHE